MWFFALFLGLPIIEIALFVTLGGAIGLWATLAIILLTAVAGLAILRSPRQTTSPKPGDPREALVMVADRSLLLLAGLCLLLPGFLTDSIGLMLLLPPMRLLLIRLLGNRISAMGLSSRMGAGRSDDIIIDAEYEDISDERPPLQRPSRWTEH